MDQVNHHEYYLMRAAASRDLAERADAPKVAAIHAEFAIRYDVLAVELEQKRYDALKRAQAT